MAACLSVGLTPSTVLGLYGPFPLKIQELGADRRWKVSLRPSPARWPRAFSSPGHRCPPLHTYLLDTGQGAGVALYPDVAFALLTCPPFTADL